MEIYPNIYQNPLNPSIFPIRQVPWTFLFLYSFLKFPSKLAPFFILSVYLPPDLSSYESVGFSVFTSFWNHQFLVSEHLYHRVKKSWYPLAVTSTYFFPPSRATTTLLPVDVPILDILHKMELCNMWPFGLASSIWHNVFKIHRCYSMYQYLIALYGWIVFHCVDIPLVAYLFMNWWTCFPPHFAYYEQCCCEYSRTVFFFFVKMCFQFSWI